MRGASQIALFAPNFDATETHRISIAASPDEVYRALWTADLGNSMPIKFLLALRSLPTFLLQRSPPRNQKLTLQTLIGSSFGLLSEKPGEEIVLGVTGRFWRPTGNVSPFKREDFDNPVPPGLARGVWNFRVEETAPHQTTLYTETRVICGDTGSRRKFRAYWLFVRPFSGLIRRLMLKNVKRAAEQST